MLFAAGQRAGELPAPLGEARKRSVGVLAAGGYPARSILSGRRIEHIVMSPLEFMQRLAALAPRPRLHLIRFHGALALHTKLRAAIVPIPPSHTTTGHTGECAHAHGAHARRTWARLLKRVFDLDLERYEQCGGKMKIIAAIEEPAVIERILTPWGLAAQPPPRAPG